MKPQNLLLTTSLFLAFFAIAEATPTSPVAEINSCSVEIGFTSAKVYGSIALKDKKTRVSSVTIYYGVTPGELIEEAIASYDPVNGFSVDLSDLEDGTLYYYRVDVSVGQSTIKGTEECFVTFPQGPVDLDLPSGTKWASCNVGARLPTECGEYYAWGETKPKTVYNWSSYYYCNGDQNKLTKYITNTAFSYGSRADKLAELKRDDDAATRNMGSSWHMATTKDWQELRNYCVIREATINGIRGVIVSSKKDMNNNKKFIFLPASSELGSIRGTMPSSSGYYITASLGDLDPYVSSVNIISDQISFHNSERCEGNCTRAVTR